MARTRTGTIVKTRDGRWQPQVLLTDGTRKRLPPFPKGTTEESARAQVLSMVSAYGCGSIEWRGRNAPDSRGYWSVHVSLGGGARKRVKLFDPEDGNRLLDKREDALRARELATEVSRKLREEYAAKPKSKSKSKRVRSLELVDGTWRALRTIVLGGKKASKWIDLGTGDRSAAMVTIQRILDEFREKDAVFEGVELSVSDLAEMAGIPKGLVRKKLADRKSGS